MANNSNRSNTPTAAGSSKKNPSASSAAKPGPVPVVRVQSEGKQQPPKEQPTPAPQGNTSTRNLTSDGFDPTQAAVWLSQRWATAQKTGVIYKSAAAPGPSGSGQGNNQSNSSGKKTANEIFVQKLLRAVEVMTPRQAKQPNSHQQRSPLQQNQSSQSKAQQAPKAQ